MWDPQLQNQIEELKMVHENAAQIVTNDYTTVSTVTNKDETAEMDTTRRKESQNQSIKFYKRINN